MSRGKATESLSSRTVILSLVIVAALGFALGTQVTSSDPTGQTDSASLGINVDTPELQRIVLQSHRGLATNWGSFAGVPRLVFFGYTFCPDICPLGLSNVAGAIDILDEQSIELDPIFVTVDPKRDTPEVLREYVSAFHERFEGLTGKEDQIRELASAFLAYYEVSSETKDDEYYLVDHTSYVYLVSKDGELLGYYPESKISDELATIILRDMLKERGGSP